MACGGCAERAKAIRAALTALAHGDGDEAKRQATVVRDSAAVDIARVKLRAVGVVKAFARRG